MFILLASFLLLALLVYLIAPGLRRRNFTDPNGPVFNGEYAEQMPQFDGTFKIVSWNVHHAENVPGLIETLQQVEVLSQADVLLLQEIDENSTDRIAHKLLYNYVYYPATTDRSSGKYHGNATLSLWPILSSAKIVLPNSLPEIKEARVAVQATLDVSGIDVLVYNGHLETIWMLPGGSFAQIPALAEQVQDLDSFVVIGGDFNTWTPSSIQIMDDRFNRAGLVRLTREAGYTFELLGVPLVMDHIFSQPVPTYSAGVWRETNLSDHYPVWALIETSLNP